METKRRGLRQRLTNESGCASPSRAVLLYCHYDVQPPGGEEHWTVPVPRFVADELAAALGCRGPDELAFTGHDDGAVLRVRAARRSWFDTAVHQPACPAGFQPHEAAAHRRVTGDRRRITGDRRRANVKAVQQMLGPASAADDTEHLLGPAPRRSGRRRGPVGSRRISNKCVHQCVYGCVHGCVHDLENADHGMHLMPLTC